MIEIIAHRGASRDRHENTMPAFEAALAQGADGIELDVHATADGIVVVHHDPVVRTAAGEVVEIAAVSGLALSGVRLRSGDAVPTLDAVLALVGPALTVYVEVKGVGIERAVAECLDRHPGVRTAVHAFDHRIPVATRALRLETPIGLLSASYPLDLHAMLRPAGAGTLWQHTDLIDEELVDDAHAIGARVIAWTENRPGRARALMAMGVDAVCTDIPGEMRRALMPG